ncbi:MAG: Rrf2 family transcriptional regulator [Candidatus Hydrogenedentes bacterium]|nr:Rrf2 family transcriptional regulator [Candidatus Hydrogenedentota bacterium]
MLLANSLCPRVDEADMLSKTSETAILALVYLCREGANGPVAPTQIAADLGASASYMAKVSASLTRAGLLRAHRGVKGGVTLSRQPSEISLLAIVEACQGHILGNYCQDDDRVELVCAFHHAMLELHRAFVGVLARWTLADLASRTQPAPELARVVNCRMACLHNSTAKKKTSPKRAAAPRRRN